VSRKTIAIVLLVLVGGVGAYNAKFFIDRAKKKAKSKVIETSEREKESTHVRPLRVASAAEAASVPEPQVKSNGAQPDGQPAAAPAVGEGAGTKLAGKLPGVFGLQWIDPFHDNPTATAQTLHLGAGKREMNWGDPSARQGPVVSAVLIGRRSRRALIDGRILSKGDGLPGTDAVVCAIYAEGVEIKIGGVKRYFALGGGSTSSPGARPDAPPRMPPSSRDTMTSAEE